MRNIFLLTGFLVSALAGHSQKCKYDSEKKDPFTGKSQKGTSAILARYQTGQFFIVFQAEEKKYLVGLSMTLPGRNENYVESGDTLFIALDNGQLLSLRAVDRYLPNVQVIGSGIFTYYEPKFAITEIELRKLETFAMKAAKIKLGSQPFVPEVSPKNAEKVKKAASCILL